MPLYSIWNRTCCLVILSVLHGTAYAAITWDPNTATIATVDASVSTACDIVMQPLATSSMGSISYAINSQTPLGGNFSIGPYQGDDTLLCDFSSISTSTQTSYSVVIGMTAGSDTGTQTITVTVTNLPAPAITWDPNTATTAEVDASDNTACDNVMQPLATSSQGSVSYAITSETPSGGGFFIGDYQGDDTLLCDFSSISTSTHTSYSVVIGMTAGSDTGTQTITVTVTNLPAPAITWDPNTATTAEVDASDNTACDNVMQPLATSSQGSVSYAINSQTPLGGSFSIGPYQGDDTLLCDFSSISTSTHTSYSVVIGMTAGSDTGTQTITVTVTNLPAPAITWDPYTPTTAEVDASDNTTCETVLRPRANSSQGSVSYAITSQTPSGGGFSIGDYQGDDTLLCDFSSISTSRETSYTVVIGMTAGSVTGEQTITVSVFNLPPLSFVSPQDGSVIPICENTEASEIIASLSASRGEKTSGFTFSIVTSTNLFDIDADNLIAAANLTENALDVDNGQQTSYAITLRVSDGIDTVDIAVTIEVEDDNDNSPRFTSSQNTFEIIETAQGRETVGTVEAEDDDLDQSNNQVTFSLTGTDVFLIGSTSGVISLADQKTLNFTAQSTYSFTVTESDNGDGDSQLSTDQQITVYVRVAPVFTDLYEPQTVLIQEDVGQDVSIYDVRVSDEDGYPNQLTVTLDTQTPDSPIMFILNGNSLHTATSETLDAETRQTYNLTFSVTDGNYTTQSMTLTVTVEDVNDETPVFTMSNNVDVAENHQLNTSVTTITATDDDISDAFSTVSYSIEAGNDIGLFSIGTATGEIVLLEKPYLYQYVLTVKASDGISPPRTSTASLTITVDHTAVDECIVNGGSPCGENAQECIPIVNNYHCMCKPGWTGRHCETNIEDCVPNPCNNTGECIDGVASFTCNCSAGWTGATCSEACSGNRYGRNCDQTCLCNSSRLVENVDSQMCDIITGDCKCGPQWQGYDCSQDVDECLVEDTCAALVNTVCDNSHGGHECICKTWYKLEGDTCVLEVTTPNNTALIGGAVGGSVVGIIIAVLVAVILLKMRKQGLSRTENERQIATFTDLATPGNVSNISDPIQRETNVSGDAANTEPLNVDGQIATFTDLATPGNVSNISDPIQREKNVSGDAANTEPLNVDGSNNMYAGLSQYVNLQNTYTSMGNVNSSNKQSDTTYANMVISPQ